MADLLRLSTVRLPEEVNLAQVQKRGLYTHYAPGNEDRIERDIPVANSFPELPFEVATLAVDADKLYREFESKFSSGRFDKVAVMAHEFLSKSGVFSLKDLNATTHMIVNLCRSEIEFDEGGFGEALALVKSSSKNIERALIPDLGRLSNSILAAAICQTDPEHLPNLIRWWRAAAAVEIAYVRNYSTDPTDLTRSIIRDVYRAPLFLPHWFFKLKGCRPLIDLGPLPNALADSLRAQSAYAAQVQGRNVTPQPNVPRDPKAPPVQPPPPQPDPCDCKFDAVCRPQNPACICITPFQTNYYLLKDQLHCYVPADLAYIEVVAAGETRKRTHEFKELKESIFEEENTVVQKEERDLQVTDRSTLNTEIEKQMQASLDVSARVEGRYGRKGEFEITSDGKLSKSSAEKQAREVFREVVSKAAYSMQTTTRTLRKERRQTETTETNTHKFENSTDKPFITKYFYVNQQRKAQVYDYGMRLIVEVMVPSPAALFEALWQRRAVFTESAPEEPCKPEVDKKLVTPETINAGNYRALAS